MFEGLKGKKNNKKDGLTMYGYLCGNYVHKENVQLSKLPPPHWLGMGFGVVGLVSEELQLWIWGIGCSCLSLSCSSLEFRVPTPHPTPLPATP